MKEDARNDSCRALPSEWLLKELLPRVSRSFYLTLQVVPVSVRDQVGLAYLFCRAADTLADTDLLPSYRRLPTLLFYRKQFYPEPDDFEGIARIGRELVPSQTSSAERILLERLPDCFEVLASFDPEDRRLIGELVRTLTRGMEMDLLSFSEGKPGMPQALRDMDDLDRYIYFVAGCVGEFWTRMCRKHIQSLRHWDEERMAVLGVRFGKGLQMTNVLKDLSRDLARGRSYLPETLLEKHGIDLRMLSDPASREILLPLLRDLVGLALEHLDAGWKYILSIPRSEPRLRLACLWPYFFALSTLRKTLRSRDLLDPRRPVKIGRGSVYTTMALSTLGVYSNSALRVLSAVLRRRLIQTIDRIA
ncbi:MAG TPA: phytoene/squalene synthase family protein [Nitrospiria bacterium]|nr:phytoene/squalene synthase family protein [Nitrospiria bacterium]